MPIPIPAAALGVSAVTTLTLCLALTSATTVAAQSASNLRPDGTTTTTVKTDGSGRATVTIAAPTTNTGTSLNRWTQFDVGKPGADFDNRSAQARLIVNEVTGGLRSQIEGDINVLGPRANFIVANAAGIWVNGAQFTNIGSLALATGTVSSLDFSPSPGLTQRDVLVDVKGGLLEIGPQGMSGAFNSLDLLARNLRINGPVANTTTQPNSGLRMVAGATRTQFDSSVSPVDDVTPWAYTGKLVDAGAAASAVAVDITSMGSVTAGKINIIVTDAGAGVRQAGSLTTTVGDLRISASGQLSYAGGSITSAGAFIAHSDTGLSMAAGSDGRALSITTQGDVQLLAPTVDLRGVHIEAGDATHNADIVMGLPSNLGTMTGAVSLGTASSLTGEAVPTTIRASGGLTLLAAGQAVNMNGVDIETQAGITLRAQTLSATGYGGAGQSTQSRMSSARGLIDAQIERAVRLEGTSWQGGAGVQIASQSLAVVGHVDGEHLIKSELRSNGGMVHVETSGSTQIEGSDLLARTAVVVRAGGDVSIASNAMDHSDSGQSVVASAAGGVVIHAGGDIVNHGALIQGTEGFTVNDYLLPPVDGKAATLSGTQAVELQAGGQILNQTDRANQLAIVFGSKGDVLIHAQSDIHNHTGRIISNGALDLASENGDFLNTTDKIPGANAEQSAATNTTGRWAGLIPTSSRSWTRDFGTLAIPGQLAYVVADGNATIRAKNVINRGGQINVNTGTLSLAAKKDVLLEALVTGKANYTETCLIFCRRHSSSTVDVVGGGLNANGRLTISAGHSIVNTGARVLGLAGVTLDAPNTYANAVESYTAVGLYRGFANSLGSNWAQIASGDVGGTFTSRDGDIEVNGNITLTGGDLVAKGSATVNGDRTVIRAPNPIKATVPPLGWFWGW